MKRIACMIITIMVLVTMMVPGAMAAGAGAASVSSAGAEAGETVTLKLSLSDFSAATEMLVQIRADGLELTEGQWLLDGVLQDVSGMEAVWAVGEETEINGEVLSLTFRIPEGAKVQTVYNVNCTVLVKNHGAELGSVSASGSVTCLAAPGDMDGDGQIDHQDAAELLWHTLFEDYPIAGNGDVNGDGKVNTADAVHLMWHLLFPDKFAVK